MLSRMEMKYIIFLAGLFLCVPAGIIAASLSRRIQEIVLMACVFSTALIDSIDINIMERWWYRGTTRAIEISFVDFFVLVLFFSTLLSGFRGKSRLSWPAGLGLMLVFFLYCSFSVLFSSPQLFGVFELTKMMRGLLAFLAVSLYVRSPRDVYVCIVAMGVVLVFQGCWAVLQRYFWGYMRVRGSFVHPSALANYCCLLAPLLLAVALAKVNLLLRGLCILGWTLAVVATILSITRMAIITLIFVSFAVLMCTLSTHFNPKRLSLVALLGIVGLGLFIRGYDRMMERHAAMVALEEAGVEGAGRRVYYVEALNMANSNAFGVGLNNWSWWLSEEKGYPYHSTEEPGDGYRAVMAHSAFALALGELGWPGLFIFIALWLQWLFLSGRFLFVRKPDLLTNVLVGCFFSVMAAAFSAMTEHNFRSQLFFIVFNMVLGLMVAVRRMKKDSECANLQIQIGVNCYEE